MGHVVAAISLLGAQSAITMKVIRILLLTPFVLELSVYVLRETKKVGQSVAKVTFLLYSP